MKVNALLASTIALSFAGVASADLSPVGAGGPIADGITNHTVAGVTNYTINVAASGPIASINSVTLTNLTHTWMGDLQAILIAPNGDNVHLFSRPGATGATSFGSANNFGGTYSFTEGGVALPTNLATVPSGAYARATNPLAGATVGVDNDTYSIFNGDDVNGVWTLQIKDWAAADVGSLGSWQFDYTLVPAPGALALLGLAGLAGTRRRRA